MKHPNSPKNSKKTMMKCRCPMATSGFRDLIGCSNDDATMQKIFDFIILVFGSPVFEYLFENFRITQRKPKNTCNTRCQMQDDMLRPYHALNDRARLAIDFLAESAEFAKKPNIIAKVGSFHIICWKSTKTRHIAFSNIVDHGLRQPMVDFIRKREIPLRRVLFVTC